MHLFKAVVLVNKGLECDCCVDVSQVHASVFARDEEQALKLVKEFDIYASVEVISLQDSGSVEKVENTGVMVTSSPRSIYRGYYGHDEAIAKAVAEAKAVVSQTQSKAS